MTYNYCFDQLIKRIQSRKPDWALQIKRLGGINRIVFGPSYGPEALGFIVDTASLTIEELFDALLTTYAMLLESKEK